jgi:hypothetical protein
MPMLAMRAGSTASRSLGCGFGNLITLNLSQIGVGSGLTLLAVANRRGL